MIVFQCFFFVKVRQNKKKKEKNAIT